MVKTAIILAAGYSTRLYPLTKNFPKPLLEIAPNKPVINYILDKLTRTSIKKVYIVTNNKYYQYFLNWKKSLNFNLDIEILNDNTNSNEDRLGSVGDMFFAIKTKNIQEPALIISGDNLFNFELSPIINHFKQKNKDTIALYEENNIEVLKQLGIVKLNKNNKITFFEEKPLNPFSNLASIGIYVYTSETITLIKKYLNLDLNPDRPGDFLQWLYKEKEILGYSVKGAWFDIGTSESLEKARKEF